MTVITEAIEIVGSDFHWTVRSSKTSIAVIATDSVASSGGVCATLVSVIAIGLVVIFSRDDEVSTSLASSGGKVLSAGAVLSLLLGSWLFFIVTGLSLSPP